MAWTAPRTWTTGEVVTAALLNTHVRDNLRYLKGIDGPIEISDNITFPAAETVDGVDVSAHKAGTAKAQHTGGAGDHNHESAGAEGGNLDAATITSGRLNISRLPAGTLGYVLTAKGAGVDPAYEAVVLTEDILGSQIETDNVSTARTYYAYVTGPLGGEQTLVTKTQSYDSNSLAVAVGYMFGHRAGVGNITLRLYMDAVLEYETADIATVPTNNVLIATRALSGSTECKLVAYHYGGTPYLYQSGGDNGTPAAAMIAIGSIKA